MGEDRPKATQQLIRFPFLFRHTVKLQEPMVQRTHPLMWSPGVINPPVAPVGSERLPVEVGDVVQVQIAVVDDLPPWPRNGLLANQMRIGQSEVFEHVVIPAEELIKVRIDTRHDAAEHKPSTLDARDLDESVAVSYEIAEQRPIGNPNQLSLSGVGPRVVRAGEPLLRSVPVIDQPRPSMPTGVDKGADYPVGTSRDEDWCPCDGQRPVGV